MVVFGQRGPTFSKRIFDADAERPAPNIYGRAAGAQTGNKCIREQIVSGIGPSGATLHVGKRAAPDISDPACESIERIDDVLAVYARYTGEAGVLAAHVRRTGVRLNA